MIEIDKLEALGIAALVLIFVLISIEWLQERKAKFDGQKRNMDDGKQPAVYDANPKRSIHDDY
jgi:hypothetical protein